jgi:Spy/CpxP family protein refolding chaperone
MRRLLAVLTLVLMATGCSDATGPVEENVEAQFEEMAGVAWGVTQVAAADGSQGLMARLGRLPADLALTAEQRALIRSAVESFVTETAADRALLAAVLREAVDARNAGSTPAEVRAILATGAEARARLHEAERALHQAVMAVLTPAQRAWLADRPAQDPRPCALSDTQRTEISGLLAAFEDANASDIALVRSVFERARAAQQAGASRADVAAILAEGRDAVQRLKAARQALRDAVRAVLTPAQLAAGCFR